MKNRGGILLALGIIGSGITAAAVLNDVGAVTIFSMLGSKYGYSIIWMLVVMTVVLVTVQEMISRMAVVTGKGLSDLIREEFGVKWAFMAMLMLLIANICSAIANFSGVAVSLGMFNVSKYITIPVIVVLMWIILIKNNYWVFERIFLAFQAIILTYIALAIVLKPDFKYIAFKAFNPQIEFNITYFIMIIAIIGAVVTPYMQFYMQSLVVNKSIPVKKYGYERAAVYIGSIIAIIVDFLILICSFEVFGRNHIKVNTIEGLSSIFTPLYYNSHVIFASIIFTVSILACFIIPLCTSFSICRAFGFEYGEKNKIKDAPVFFGVFLFVTVLSSVIVLIPGINFLHTIFITQIIAGLMSSVIFIFIIKIASDPEVMGSRINGSFKNILVYTFISFVVIIVFIAIVLKLF